jgi:hypothetical protein
MLREKAVTLLKIRPEEMRMVTLMAVLFLVVQSGQGFGDTAAFALFVSQNVDRLPYMYVPLGLIVFFCFDGVHRQPGALSKCKCSHVVFSEFCNFAFG